MLTLYCVVVGEGRPFPVVIDAEKTVGILKDMIKEKIIYDGRADALELYLAFKDGAGLSSDVAKAMTLDGLQDFKMMDPVFSIKNSKHFGENFEPNEGEIYVLVVVSEGAVASEISGTAQMVKKVDEMHAQIVQTKRKRYVHSQVGSSNGKKLLGALNIQVDAVDAVPFATSEPTPVQAFRWASVNDECGREITLTEEQQRQCYRSYVEDNIGAVLAEKKLCVLGVEKGGDILSVAVPGYDIDLAGRTDILVLSDIAKKHPLHLQFLPGVRLLIEVKNTKDLKLGSVYQALSELIALDLLTKDPVMALLTDLVGHWQFFWVSESSSRHTIIQTLIITAPGEAFQVIRTLLAQSPSTDEDMRLPCFEEPLKRRKLVKMLPFIAEGGESGGIRESIERYYDIASMLGPDIDMARAVAHQITRSIPSFSMYT
ncbi:Aste57867_4417 [Aphanomyces stellatus]|uniref:Aste57867_4417 protein n=1 Tax=Aphanomyces stellatus TaxID=120398 RepID=A0A485KCL8_9STRA|nr:hypothetical protein As57867_004405 [Aphanomyces stellatus]VFT81528.1 Aste57867_4417 [Aphanomyces stellatus]